MLEKAKDKRQKKKNKKNTTTMYKVRNCLGSNNFPVLFFVHITVSDIIPHRNSGPGDGFSKL